MSTDGDLEPRLISVRGPQGDSEWTLVPSRPLREWSMDLVGPDRTWSGSGRNCFDALRDLRLKLDQVHVLVGVNGARPNCTLSGMLADMGEGRSVYSLETGVTGRPPMLRTLDPAPLDVVGSVAEQDAFKQQWLADRDRLTASTRRVTDTPGVPL